ncbi:MAG: asparagine synthase (glutamine-hydrolyzing), partial [Gammaproteobacteria bacterium]|nr:asparagine synthase (glutamine-hydrolyzing) [Gammaproteobacteria bacterium]
MCGIAGALHQDGEPVSPVIVGRMADALAHRGPDDQGVFVDGAFGVGHRRLAILDLSSAGHQPMVTPDGRFVLSYNGELYNFAELRAELEAAGWRFRSRTDSEVVLYALVEWGAAALQRFNGMFALALWDKTSRELLLARDRYGIKPLYYATDDKRVLFASEIKALYAHPGFCPGIDMAGLREYMSFQNFISDRTLFDGVNMLEAGTWCRITAGGATRSERYWDFSFEEPQEAADEAALHEELLRLFRQAVQRQLVSDVPLGAYLSGGVDSGSVTAIAAAQIPNLTTFTVGFDLNSASGLELGFDERPASEYMSYVLQTEHYEMVLKAGDMERCMRSLVWHLEEPRVGQSYPNYYAARLASRFNKVVLSGTGGDELFGGYPWRYYRAAVNDDFDHYVDKYYGFWQRLLSDDVALEVMGPVAG